RWVWSAGRERPCARRVDERRELPGWHKGHGRALGRVRGERSQLTLSVEQTADGSAQRGRVRERRENLRRCVAAVAEQDGCASQRRDACEVDSDSRVIGAAQQICESHLEPWVELVDTQTCGEPEVRRSCGICGRNQLRAGHVRLEFIGRGARSVTWRRGIRLLQRTAWTGNRPLHG